MSLGVALPGLLLAEWRLTRRLFGAVVRRIEALGQDTYAQEDRFFSFRRATHRNEPSYGRQISLIGLPS